MLEIEIEESPVKVSLDISMETQKIPKEEKITFKRIHYSLFIFTFVQVIWYMTFSEPLTVLIGNEPIFPFLLSDDIISRTARLIMIYHSLAVPFLVANTFWILEHYPVRQKWIPSLKVTLLPGAWLVGIFGLLFAYTRYRLFHEFFYFGMLLCFIGGIIFVISAWPIAGKFPDPKNNKPHTTFRGLNLEYFNLEVLAICILISTIYGALAALENFTGSLGWITPPRDPIAFLAEAIIRHEHHDIVQDFVVSHLHIQLAQSAGMVMLVGFTTSKISGKIYKFMLLITPVGVLTLSYGAWVLNHYVIWVGAGILILVTLTMSIGGMKNVLRDRLGENYATTSRFGKIKELFKDPVKFSYYYLFALSQLLVFPQIYVGLFTDELYREHSMVSLEYGFNVGHWHQLAVVIATMLMIHAIDYFKVEGRMRKILGWDFFIAINLTFIPAMIHMVRPYVWIDNLFFMYLTFVGVWFLLAGYIMGLYALGKRYKIYRKAERYPYILMKEEINPEI
ncbi:MAG: hypothetical protein ACFE85_11275 [Candidatus Hodarchaeota archaeon]